MIEHQEAPRSPGRIKRALRFTFSQFVNVDVLLLDAFLKWLYHRPGSTIVSVCGVTCGPSRRCSNAQPTKTFLVAGTFKRTPRHLCYDYSRLLPLLVYSCMQMAIKRVFVVLYCLTSPFTVNGGGVQRYETRFNP